jgi:hypothetical protein
MRTKRRDVGVSPPSKPILILGEEASPLVSLLNIEEISG